MPKYPFLGYDTRIYPAYIDNETDTTLTASPGESYDMRPAGSVDLPVPPDGLWGGAEAPAVTVPASKPAAPDPPPAAVKPNASTEDKGNN